MAIELSKELTGRIVDILFKITDKPVNFIDTKGLVIAAAEKERVGKIHEAGKMVVTTDVEELAVTEEMAAKMSNTKTGYIGRVIYKGQIVGGIGIGGSPEVAKPLQKLAEILIIDALELEENQKKELDLRKEMIDSITDISETMQVLSLNGSIQAAKLGHAGEAFKVVSDEMNKLAGSIGEGHSTVFIIRLKKNNS